MYESFLNTTCTGSVKAGYVADFVKFTRVGDFSDVLKLTDIASNRLPVPSFALVAYKLANQNSPTRKT